jgi:putative transposase
VPRKPRFNLPGYPQHVLQRGNNREPCFYAEADYQRYLEDLTEIAVKYSCEVHAYVLMTNHVHLLVSSQIDYGLSQMMQALGRRYVYYINNRYRRTGTLWEGRFKASLIDTEAYLLTCMRYIELNPIRANMVTHPGEYSWSSYAANAQGEDDSLITPHHLYTGLGETAALRQAAYRELFRHHMDDELLHEIREALNHEIVLGRSYFKDKIESLAQRQTRVGQPGRPCIRKNHGDHSL